MRVAAVDDDVARLKNFEQLLNHAVDRRARLDHHENLARLFEIVDKFLHRPSADYVLALRATVHKSFHFVYGTVVDGDREALRLHVHDEVLAHHGKTDKTDISFLHCISP